MSTRLALVEIIGDRDRENAAQHWHTQMCCVPVAALNEKPCVLEVDASRIDPSRDRGDEFVLEATYLFNQRRASEQFEGMDASDG